MLLQTAKLMPLKRWIYFLGRVEDTMGNRENVTSIFSFSQNVFNPLPDMPILGSSDSTSDKDTMSEIWTDGDIVI